MHAKSLIIFLHLSMLSLLTPICAADELVGEYIYFECQNLPDGQKVHHRYDALLWIDDDAHDDAYIDYVLQLNLSDTEVAFFPVQYIDDEQMFFDKDGRMFVFKNLLNCGGHIKAAGRIIGDQGLWQLWEKPVEILR